MKKLRSANANELLIRLIKAIIIDDDLEQTINPANFPNHTSTDNENESDGDADDSDIGTDNENANNTIVTPVAIDTLEGTSKQHVAPKTQSDPKIVGSPKNPKKAEKNLKQKSSADKPICKHSHAGPPGTAEIKHEHEIQFQSAPRFHPD